MKRKSHRLAMLAAAACCLAPAGVLASAVHGQGSTGNNDSARSSAQSTLPAAHANGFADNGDAVRAGTDRSASASRTSAQANPCDNGAGTSGITAGFASCSHAHGGNDSGADNGNSRDGLGWQSLLPGSIQ